MKSHTILALFAAALTSAVLSSPAAHAGSLDSSTTTGNTAKMATAKREAAQMVPAVAVLMQTIDARKAHSGELFRARLTQTVELKSGAALPKGTELVGKIVKDAMKPDGTSTLALRFTAADMKQGTSVPIVATIVGVAPPEYGDESSSSDDSLMPSAWTQAELMVEQIGALPGFDLHSSIASPDSATFTSKKKSEVKLADRTQFSLAIAGRSKSSRNGGV